MKRHLVFLHGRKLWERSLMLLIVITRGIWSYYQKPVSCKWVYTIKYKSDGSIERPKARLVIRGFTQKPGIDYHKTYSLVVKMTTIRSLIATAVKKKWHFCQLDMNNAFLHGELDKDIYMTPPPGLPLPQPNMVCKHKKSLYVLKQASRQWHAKLSKALRSEGYRNSKNDYSLFFEKMGGTVVFIAIYFDDILVAGDNEVEIQHLKSFLDSNIKIKDLGTLNYFLELELYQVPNGLVMTQRAFALNMIKEFGVKPSASAVSPLDPSIKLKPDEGAPISDPSLYKKIVGKLNYLTHTRSGIAFSVQHLSQYLQDPRFPHLTAAMHVLKYINTNASQGLFFNNNPNFSLEEYCD